MHSPSGSSRRESPPGGVLEPVGLAGFQRHRAGHGNPRPVALCGEAWWTASPCSALFVHRCDAQRDRGLARRGERESRPWRHSGRARRHVLIRSAALDPLAKDADLAPMGGGRGASAYGAVVDPRPPTGRPMPLHLLKRRILRDGPRPDRSRPAWPWPALAPGAPPHSPTGRAFAAPPGFSRPNPKPAKAGRRPRRPAQRRQLRSAQRMDQHRVGGELLDQPLPAALHFQAAVAFFQQRQGLGFGRWGRRRRAVRRGVWPP